MNAKNSKCKLAMYWIKSLREAGSERGRRGLLGGDSSGDPRWREVAPRQWKSLAKTGGGSRGPTGQEARRLLPCDGSGGLMK